MARKTAPLTESERLRRELRAAAQELALAYDRFDQAAEPELVEACIYEIQAVHARYSYFYRAIRQCDGASAAATPMEEAAVWM